MSLQDEAKRLLPYVQALAEGKTITFTSNNTSAEVVTLLELFVYDEELRKFLHKIDPTLQIKKEPAYRPYYSDEVLLVGKVVQMKISKTCKDLIVSQQGEYGLTVGDRALSYEDLFATYEFLDGSPCGVTLP